MFTYISNILKKKKLFSSKRLVIAIIVALLLVTLGKYFCYEFFTDVPTLRKHIGRVVVYQKNSGFEIQGVLKECKYEINDKIGFFSLRITIEGHEQFSFDPALNRKVEVSESFSVFDVKKVDLVD